MRNTIGHEWSEKSGFCCRYQQSVEPAGIPLTLADAGTRVRIVQLRAGARMRERLLGMGIGLEQEISVLQRQNGGAVLIETGGKRYALCCGMAQAIRVTGGRP
ncbi:MAG: FeoA domain-containing protein [Desulfobulbus sp.]|nr:FeoA domain-containing protein [Desulfobulbus sp.]